jgi:hypothetical protein
MKLIDLDSSLSALPDIGTNVSRRAISLVNRPLAELSSGDFAFCLRQSIAVEHTAPHALALVAQNPLLEAEHYPGDLLLSLLHVARKNLLSATQVRELRETCSEANAAAETIATEVVPAVHAFISMYDDS